MESAPQLAVLRRNMCLQILSFEFQPREDPYLNLENVEQCPRIPWIGYRQSRYVKPPPRSTATEDSHRQFGSHHSHLSVPNPRSSSRKNGCLLRHPELQVQLTIDANRIIPCLRGGKRRQSCSMSCPRCRPPLRPAAAMFSLTPCQ